MPSYNRVILIGRLTRDPELRYTASGLAVASFSLAVDRRSKNPQGERMTDFFRCTAWRQTAEFMSNYIHKGRLVAVEGRIEIDEVTGQDGQKQFYTKIVCDTVQALDSQRDGGAPDGGAAAGGYGGEAGYYPDEDMAPAPQMGGARGGAPAMAAAPAPAPRQAPPRPAPVAGGAPSAAPARPAPAPRQPEPAYPDDDFDDSDPFADE
jgi:single-strand DNA-binding protein